MKKAILISTLVVNLIQFNCWKWFWSHGYERMFIHLMILNYALFYIGWAWGKIGKWERFFCQAGFVFCINDAIDEITKNHVARISEYIFCGTFIIYLLWIAMTKKD